MTLRYRRADARGSTSPEPHRPVGRMWSGRLAKEAWGYGLVIVLKAIAVSGKECGSVCGPRRNPFDHRCIVAEGKSRRSEGDIASCSRLRQMCAG